MLEGLCYWDGFNIARNLGVILDMTAGTLECYAAGCERVIMEMRAGPVVLCVMWSFLCFYLCYLCCCYERRRGSGIW